MVSGIAVTDANGHPIPCETMLTDVRTALASGALDAPRRRQPPISRPRPPNAATPTTTPAPMPSRRRRSRLSATDMSEVTAMTDLTYPNALAEPGRMRPNRVPQVTPDFWLIKLMAVTMGETAADYLAVNLGLGLADDLGHHDRGAGRRADPAVLAPPLRALDLLARSRPDLHRRHADHRQPRRQPRRQPGDLDDRLHAGARAHLLGRGSGPRARSRSTPSSRPGARPSTGSRSSSPSRSAPPPATSSRRSSGSATSRPASCSARSSLSLSIGYFWLGLDAILAFWLVYIFTRPLGASFGDLLSQPADYGGLGFGTIVTSLIFPASSSSWSAG